jgi:hypothetical protein
MTNISQQNLIFRISRLEFLFICSSKCLLYKLRLRTFWRNFLEKMELFILVIIYFTRIEYYHMTLVRVFLTVEPRPNITMIVNGACTAVNRKIRVVNGQYFTRLAWTVLRPFVDTSYTMKNPLKIEYSIVYDTMKYDRNTVLGGSLYYTIRFLLLYVFLSFLFRSVGIFFRCSIHLYMFGFFLSVYHIYLDFSFLSLRIHMC